MQLIIMNARGVSTVVAGTFSLCLALLLFYVGSFTWRFEIFGDPVRDNAHGWLEPTIRGDLRTVDIGKVGYYEGTDFSLYRTYRRSVCFG